jgi:hypothetical protein
VTATDGTQYNPKFLISISPSNQGDDGVDGVTLNLTATQVVFNVNGSSTYDPASTSSIALSAFGGTITSVTYTDNQGYITLSGQSNSGCTATFSTGRTKAEVEQSNTVTATVTGTTSDGTTGVSFGSITVDIPTAINGEIGEDGLRTVQGYLYYEKTTAGAPSTPGTAVYTFSSGDINGGSGATEVLGLSDTSAVDKWTNEPRTQDPTSSNTHWTVRYYGTESVAGSSTVTVSYSNIVQYTNFSGVVTFSGGTFSEGTTPITTIDGGNISTGTISAESLTITTKELVNPVSTTKHLAGWGGIAANNETTSTNYLEYDATENAIALSNYIGSGSTYIDDVALLCDSFIVNPNKIYKISYKVKFNNSTGVWYLGLRYNSSPYEGRVLVSGSAGGDFNSVFNRWDTTRTQGTLSSNLYFVAAEPKTDFTSGYSEYVHYLFGANRNIADVPDFVDQADLNNDANLGGISNRPLDTDFPFAQVVPSGTAVPHVNLRFLHWDNTTGVTERIMYIKDISVTEIDSGKIVADNITAGAITSEQLEISNSTTGTQGIFMGLDGGNPKIEIHDGTALRVKIGYLGT